MMDYIIVIPARYESSRLPGKPLIDIAGKSLLERTYNQCLKAVGKEKIVVATDDERIRKFCDTKNMQVVMTSSSCLTGTDRVAEVAQQLNASYYINVQGDEPLMNPQDILDTIQATKETKAAVINGYAPITSVEDYHSVNVPKVVFSTECKLLYMSRSPIPGNKKSEFVKSWRQICVYAFTKEALMAFSKEIEKKPLENEEDIEILRFIELGYEVQMIPLSAESIAVDVPADVEKVIKKLKEIEQH